MSEDTARVAVTGATGQLGRRVATRLATAGLAQLLIVRDPGRAPQLPGATVAVASYADRDAAIDALTGIDTLFMVSAAEAPDRVRQHLNFIDAAVAAGIRRIVYTSFCNAAPDSTFTLGRDHWTTEEYLRGTGLATVILRDNLYADFLTMLVAPDGVIYGPAGDGLVAAVARADIAEAAANILLNPTGHDGRIYSLTGPEALDLDQVALMISNSRGEPVRYQRETVAQAYASRAGSGEPAWQLDAWVSTYTAIANGEFAEVTQDIPELTGHRATSFAELLQGS